MTSIDPSVKQVLRAYLDAVALAEPVLSELWQSSRLTLTQISVLRQLREGPQPAGRVAAAAGLSSASATRVIDRLEERGLVSRCRRTADRRCVEIHLEPDGEAVLGAVRLLLGSPVHRAVEAMSPAERDEATRVLHRMVEAARAAECATGAGVSR